MKTQASDKPLGRPPTRNATVPVQLYLTPDGKAKLRALAVKGQTSMAATVERLIQEASE